MLELVGRGSLFSRAFSKWRNIYFTGGEEAGEEKERRKRVSQLSLEVLDSYSCSEEGICSIWIYRRRMCRAFESVNS